MRTEFDYIRSALDFLVNHRRFITVELQRNLSCGYSRVIEVIDALLDMGIISIIEDAPKKYERTVTSKQIKAMKTSQMSNIMEVVIDEYS